jgi:hypothetical protein
MSKIEGLVDAVANIEASSTSIEVDGTQMLANAVLNMGAVVPELASAGSYATCKSLIGIENGFTAGKVIVLTVGEHDAITESGVTTTFGDIMYLSATEPGTVTNIAPTSPGTCVVEVGVLLMSSMMLWRPEFKYVVV